jgi:hypothetical protein
MDLYISEHLMQLEIIEQFLIELGVFCQLCRTIALKPRLRSSLVLSMLEPNVMVSCACMSFGCTRAFDVRSSLMVWCARMYLNCAGACSLSECWISLLLNFSFKSERLLAFFPWFLRVLLTYKQCKHHITIKLRG